MDGKKIPVKAVRKEDDHYYEGPFWIIADSVRDIFLGNFKIVGEKRLVDYNGNWVEGVKVKRSDVPHRILWKDEKYAEWNKDYEYDYFPRGRVSIYNGVAYMNIHSKMNIARVIDTVIDAYQLYKIMDTLNIDYNDRQGSHYDFGLR